MRKAKKGENARPQSQLDRLVERICKATGCATIGDLAIRAAAACARHCDLRKAEAASATFRKAGRVVHWFRKVIYKVARGELVLPDLDRARAVLSAA